MEAENIELLLNLIRNYPELYLVGHFNYKNAYKKEVAWRKIQEKTGIDVMCLNVEIILPTVKKFLLLYPLKTGCILTYFLTMARSVFCVLFFMTALLELVVGKPFPIRPIFVDIEITAYYTMYFSFVILLLTEFVLMVFTIHLGVGSFTGDLCCLKQYLICRIITWGFEVVFLPIVCFSNRPLIGWYLGMMFLVVLEFYFFIIVYSYYYTLAEEKEFEEGSDKIRD